MPLQDLTPELRTRLSRVERTVGWFVLLAVVILLAGFGYYLYTTANARGWFVTKINYATGLNDAAGFKIGDPVKLMGLPVGEITEVYLEPAGEEQARHGITVFFSIREPYYNYVRYDSRVRVMSDLLGNKYIEVSKGEGAPSVKTNSYGQLTVMNRFRAYAWYTNAVAENKKSAAPVPLSEITNQFLALIASNPDDFYTNAAAAHYTTAKIVEKPRSKANYYYIPALNTPDLSARLDAVANQLEAAIPNFLLLTNQVQSVLSNADSVVVRLDHALAQIDPILDDVHGITAHLREPNGALGNWLLPTNIGPQLRETLVSARAALDSAHTTMDNTDTNITMLALDLDKTLNHLADLTSNLDQQVEVNSNMVTDITTTIVHTDEFIQGLKRHWLLRSAFKTKKPKKTDPPKTGE